MLSNEIPKLQDHTAWFLNLPCLQKQSAPSSYTLTQALNEVKSIWVQLSRNTAVTEGKCPAGSPYFSKFAQWVQSNLDMHFSTQTVYQTH